MTDERTDASALPAQGLPAERVLDEIRLLRAQDRPTHGGQLFAYVYDPAVPGLDELTATAYAASAHVNGLDPTAFPSLLAMENALVGAAA
ncbi:aspartate aminotransferase family protein, partial [Micromonospora azadirachtae]